MCRKQKIVLQFLLKPGEISRDHNVRGAKDENKASGFPENSILNLVIA